MKKTRSLPRILSGLSFVFAMVAFFCNFAPSIVEDDGMCARGNLFTAIFAMEGGENRFVVVPLTIAIVLLGILVLTALMGIVFGDKAHKIVGLAELVLGIGVGVLYLLAKTFYVSTNGIPDYNAANLALGAGPICVSIFAFASAFMGFLIIALGKRKVSVE